MKIELKITKEFDVKFLLAVVMPRAWETAEINGVEDKDGNLTPCRFGDSWRVTIDIETGVIRHWPIGTTAKIHFKVCDAGHYELLDEIWDKITEIDGYVPSIMCPERGGYGDYIIMNIDENGKIQNWDSSQIQEFTNDEEY